MSAAPIVSVVIATFNRTESAQLLLADLAVQTLSPERFEVIIVDDGSAVPVAPAVAAVPRPYRLTVLRQENAGPAAARHRAIGEAAAELIVIVDDDMRVAPDFLAAHLAEHPAGSRRVALGAVHPDPGVRLSLFERFHTRGIERVASAARSGGEPLHGSNLYTGNVSFRRADYLAVGGFDPAFRISEDAELGLRLEQSGVSFVLASGAIALNGSGHASLDAWLRRSFDYGVTDARMAEKHPTTVHADPWRFLFRVNAISRPWLLASALAPRTSAGLARSAARVALALDSLGLERVALSGMTFAYGVRYYAGVGTHAGSRAAVRAAIGRCLTRSRYEELGFFARLAKLVADIRADHRAVCRADEKYSSSVRRGGGIVGDALQRIGFQMMIAYRVMRFLWGGGDRLTAKIVSRLIRHGYGADLHWLAELEPGVIIVHGQGLIVSHAARVGTGSILFQHVTLGESIHPDTRLVGAPTLEEGVHVGPGATLLGPITIGARSKLMAGVVVTRSVPPDSIVEAPEAVVRPRGVAAPAGGAAASGSPIRLLSPSRGDVSRAAGR